MYVFYLIMFINLKFKDAYIEYKKTLNKHIIFRLLKPKGVLVGKLYIMYLNHTHAFA